MSFLTISSKIAPRRPLTLRNVRSFSAVQRPYLMARSFTSFSLNKSFKFQPSLRVLPSSSFSSTIVPIFSPKAFVSRTFSSSHGLDPAEVERRVLYVVKNFYRLKDGSIPVTPTSHFFNDLGLDSLDTVELTMAFEDEFAIEIPDADAEKILSIEDAIKYIRVKIISILKPFSFI